MSYDRIGNVNVRDKGKKRSIFDKVNEIKEDLKRIIPEVEAHRIIPILSKIRTYVAHKKKGVPIGRKGFRGYRKLNAVESVVYEYLLKHGLNPSTTYRWFIATRIPGDVKDKLEKGTVSYKKAMEISANRRRVKESQKGLLLLEELRGVVGGLR